MGGGQYRRLWWRRARGDLVRLAMILTAAAPGVALGWTLTRDWISDWAAGWVIGLCGGVTAVALLRARDYARRRAGHVGAPPTELHRITHDGEPALITLHATGARARVVVPLAAGLIVVGWGVVDQLGLNSAGQREVVAALAIMIAGMIASGASGFRGPSVAMFSDRIEVRQSPGRYAIRWDDIFVAAHENGTLTLYLHQPDTPVPIGRPGPHPAYGVVVDPVGADPTTLVETIERLRRDPDARREEIGAPAWHHRPADDRAGRHLP